MNSAMKLMTTLLKRYRLTLLTLTVILCLTFYKPTGSVHISAIAGMDKIVHFVMYFTLCAVLWYENFKITLRPRNSLMVIFAVVVPIIFSGAMEYLQYLLTSYRTGDFNDFLFNVIGVLAAMLFSLYVTRPYMVWRSKRGKGKS